MPDTRPRLVRCFAAVFPHLAEEEIPRAAMRSIDKWDSLASVSLIAVIEEEFGHQVPPEDMEQFDSFASIFAYLQAKREVS
jgi:acyl carrier protein